MTLVAGCGVSTADVEATVQARIASIPTPTPQIIIQEVEVIVEKEIEVPVIKEVVVESEVIKEVPVEVEKIVEKIVEVEVEKIVTVRESGETVYIEVTPTPTPTPLPTPTATPLPDASEFIDLSLSTKTTKYESQQVFKDGLVTNNHPTETIQVRVQEFRYDDDGYEVSSDIKRGGSFLPRDVVSGSGTCIYPNETHRFRIGLNTTISSGWNSGDFIKDPEVNHGVQLITYWTSSSGWQGERQDKCGDRYKENIDESLLDMVDINIVEDVSWRSFNVEIINRSIHTVSWYGEYELKDEFGYIIVRGLAYSQTEAGTSKIKPNQRISFDVGWQGRDLMVSDGGLYVGGIGEYLNEPITDLGIGRATLKTIVLSKVD